MLFESYKNLINNETYIFLGVLIFTIIFYYVYNKRNKKSYNIPPGPIGLPIVGYLPFLGKKPHKKLFELSKKYGNIFSVYFGQTLTVVCNDWDSTEEILNKTETNDRPDGLFDALPYGAGMSSVNGKEWVEVRRVAVRSMREVGLGRPQWEELLQGEVDEIIKVLRVTKGQCIDAREVFSTTFTNNLMSLLFNTRLPSNNPDAIFLTDTVDYIVERFLAVSWDIFLPKLSYLMYMLGLHSSKEIIQNILDYSKFVTGYVDKELEKHGNDESTFIGLFNKEVQNQKNNPNTFINKKSLYGNMQTLLIGGTESTRTAMVWLLKNMAKHPDVQKKVQKELDSVLGKDGKITWSDRHKVPYTFYTIMESLRIKSMAPLSAMRKVNADIKVQGYDVPKGTYVLINQWGSNNDLKYWSEPKEFKPERFMKEGKQINVAPEGFVAFSVGRRNCPGRQIALMELLEYFISIMQNFTVLPPENGFIKYNTIYGLTYQATSMMLRFIPREEDAASKT